MVEETEPPFQGTAFMPSRVAFVLLAALALVPFALIARSRVTNKIENPAAVPRGFCCPVIERVTLWAQICPPMPATSPG